MKIKIKGIELEVPDGARLTIDGDKVTVEGILPTILLPYLPPYVTMPVYQNPFINPYVNPYPNTATPLYPEPQITKIICTDGNGSSGPASFGATVTATGSSGAKRELC